MSTQFVDGNGRQEDIDDDAVQRRSEESVLVDALTCFRLNKLDTSISQEFQAVIWVRCRGVDGDIDIDRAASPCPEPECQGATERRRFQHLAKFGCDPRRSQIERLIRVGHSVRIALTNPKLIRAIVASWQIRIPFDVSMPPARPQRDTRYRSCLHVPATSSPRHVRSQRGLLPRERQPGVR